MTKVYHVNKALHMVLIFMPLLNLWAWWRVGKLLKGIGLNVLHYPLMIISLTAFGVVTQDVLEPFVSIPLLVLFYIAPAIPAIYFMNKWTNERNALYHKQEALT